jgi:hypothetical protein
MATQIIAAFRRYAPRLRGNTFLIATELAHRMNGQGYGRVAYSYLAHKAHCSPRTAIRQIAKLLDLGLIRKVVIRTPMGCDWNQYYYIGPRVHSASPPVKTRYDNLSRTLPKPEEREKESSLREDWEKQKKGLRFYTPGSDQWNRTCEEIVYLEGLLAATGAMASAACRSR